MIVGLGGISYPVCSGLLLPFCGELAAVRSELSRRGSHAVGLSSREDTVLPEASILSVDWLNWKAADLRQKQHAVRNMNTSKTENLAQTSLTHWFLDKKIKKIYHYLNMRLNLSEVR